MQVSLVLSNAGLDILGLCFESGNTAGLPLFMVIEGNAEEHHGGCCADTGSDASERYRGSLGLRSVDSGLVSRPVPAHVSLTHRSNVIDTDFRIAKDTASVASGRTFGKRLRQRAGVGVPRVSMGKSHGS